MYVRKDIFYELEDVQFPKAVLMSGCGLFNISSLVFLPNLRSVFDKQCRLRLNFY